MRLLVLASCAALAACGGGSTSNSGGDVITDPPAGRGDATIITSPTTGISVDTSISELASTLDDVNAVTDTLSETTTVPPGSAEYVGFASILESAPNTEDLSFVALGTLTATVDFDTNSISADAIGFNQFDIAEINALDGDANISPDDITSAPIAGSLSLSDDNDSITGSLTTVSGDVATYDIGVESIDFLGGNADAIDIFGLGSSSVTGRVDNDVEFNATGERQ